MLAFAAGLRSLGVRPGDRVSLFSENSSRWLVADQGIMFNGAADAVRCFWQLHSPISSLLQRPQSAQEKLIRAACACLCVKVRDFVSHIVFPVLQVRGSTTPVEEQAYILRQSRSSGLIVQASLQHAIARMGSC